MKIHKEPTLFVNKHVYAFPKDTYPKYSFPFQKQLESENTAKMEVPWNDSEKLQAANSLFNQEFGTIINHVPSILMDLNSPAISWNSKLQIEQLVPKSDNFLNFPASEYCYKAGQHTHFHSWPMRFVHSVNWSVNVLKP